ncbi:MAG: hypothetical protein AAFX87_07190 [Bacteroidota bacterium]
MKNIFLFICILCLSTSNILAQDKLRVEFKDGPKPDVYINGTKYDYTIFELLDQDKIASVTVIKDQQALKKYNAPNGVIVVKTKDFTQQMISVDESKIKVADPYLEPLIIIDGDVADKSDLSKLNPSKIKHIEVVKGEKAMEKYNALNGVIIITTKK